MGTSGPCRHLLGLCRRQISKMKFSCHDWLCFSQFRRAIAPRKTAVAFRAPSGYKEVTAGLGRRRGDGRRCSRWVDKEVPAGLGRRRGDGRRCSRWWIPEENVCENFLRLLCMFARAGSPNYTRWSVQGGLHQANRSLDFSSAVRVV